ncbi:hypothetical protein ACFL6F_02790 [Planctomycetota bacterium]
MKKHNRGTSAQSSSAVILCGCVLVVLAAFAGFSFAEEVSFKTLPKAKAKNDKVEITFTPSSLCDVTVAVLDSSGTIIRHLASGMLGDNPPQPLKKGLSQQIIWDNRDDFGKSADPKSCRILVGLGARPVLGKILAYKPGIAFAPRAVTPGPDGLLYVLMEHGQTKSTFLLQAYTKEGTYVRTVMPFPATLSEERLKGIPYVKRKDGTVMPCIGLPNFRDLYPISTGMRPQTMPITRNGTIVLVNASKTHNAGTRPHHLLFVSTDGGAPEGLSYIGPPACSEKLAQGMCFTALSPDEEWIYTSGHRKGSGNDDRFLSTVTPDHNVIYRIGFKDKGFAKPFIGELYKKGDDNKHLNKPRGIAVDGKGRIYVCDRGNSRIAVFNAEGSWEGKIEVADPEQVAVDPQKGTVYVMTWKRKDRRTTDCKLIKFAGIGGKAVCEISLGHSYPALGLDTTGDKMVIWIARTFWDYGERPYKVRGVQKIIDEGNTLSEPKEIISHRDIPDIFHIGASPVNDDIFVHSFSEYQFFRVDGREGTITFLPKIKGHDLAAGPQGNLYVMKMTKWKPGLKAVTRYDRNGNPLKFKGSDVSVIKDIPGNIGGHATTGSKGFSVSPSGKVVVIDKSGVRSGISIYGLNGTLLKKKIIDGMIKADGSPVMDIRGNIYIASGLKPDKEQFPQEFGLKPPNQYYEWMYGSVIKFSPSGGKLYYPPPRYRKKPEGLVWPPPNPDKLTILRKTLIKKAYAEGGEWVRSCFSALPGGRLCGCYAGRFTVDYFGRVFIPDAGRFCVHVVDANNNYLFRFGSYGNEDSQGAGSRIPKPDIPFSWPHGVSVGKRGVYVSDFINRRIIRVDLKYTALQTVKVE